MRNIKKLVSVLLFSIVCLFFSTTVTFSQQSSGELYEKALYTEEVLGELQNAIDLYQKILDNNPENKQVAAKALLHQGMCYEKLGNQEAVKKYQRLVDNYPGQKNEVAIAKERLSKLLVVEKVLATPLEPKFTKIKMPTRLLPAVKLSPDGKTIAHISDKKIWTTPLSGNIGPNIPGKPVQLNTEGIEAEWSGLAWSADGKWFAFNEDPKRKMLELEGKEEKGKIKQGIFIVPSVGGAPKRVLENYRDARVVNYRISLSPNGESLAFTAVENNEQHIYSTQVDEGSPIQLADMQAREPVYSPDGKWIAFVEDKRLGTYGGNLWITPAVGGTPTLAARAGNASSPIWSPDGSMIAYIDYNKNRQINFVEVPKGGEVAGKVTSIDAPEEVAEVKLLAGWTHNNEIGALLTSKQEFAIYTLPSTGGQASIVALDCYAMQPRWSHDGKHIFYVTFPEEKGEDRYYHAFLASVPATGGTGKPLPGDPDGKVIRQLPYQSGNRISPDGKMILSSAYTSADTMGVANWPNSKIWGISIDGKGSKQITSQEGRFADMCPSWSPDGEKIAFIRASLKNDLLLYHKMSIYIISSSDGEAKMLTPETDNYISSAVWSPNGKMIAYIVTPTTNETPNFPYLNLINVENGTVRVVGEVHSGGWNTELAWSPDSRRIALIGKNEIKVMNIDDGSIKDIETNLIDVDIWHLDWSPDGEQFVFCGGKGGDWELWLMENFLPKK